MIPVYKVEVGEEYTGATVIEPNKGSVDTIWLLLVNSLFSSNRQHLSYDVCLELRGEIIRTVLVLYCVLKLCTVISTFRPATHDSSLVMLAPMTHGPTVSGGIITSK